MPRPRAGDWLEDEVAGWRAEPIDVVASLLERAEINELGLQREPTLCREQGMEFISFPIADRGVPTSQRDADAVAVHLAAEIRAGKSVAIHCRAGIGRSSLMATCTLVRLGLEPEAALAAIGRARGLEVPDTAEQRAWSIAFASPP